MTWAYIMRTTPVMANPHEYRAALWSILHEGEAPPKKAPEPTKPGARKALPRPRGGMTKQDKTNLANFMKQIDAIKAKQIDPVTTPRAS